MLVVYFYAPALFFCNFGIGLAKISRVFTLDKVWQFCKDKYYTSASSNILVFLKFQYKTLVERANKLYGIINVNFCKNFFIK